MHKNFWNPNKIRNLKIAIEKLQKSDDFLQKTEPVKPVLERESVTFLIEKMTKLVGKSVPISESKIRERLLSYIKSNRVALRYEQACCRHVKQFSATAFLLCEVCNEAHLDLHWHRCKNCGAFNKYKI